MRKFYRRSLSLALAHIMTMGVLAGCGGGNKVSNKGGKGLEVDPAEVALPLAETATIKGLTNFPAGTESDPNNRTVFKRLEEATNVHVEWRAIQQDQWGDTIQLEMSNAKTLPDFVFNAGFGDDGFDIFTMGTNSKGEPMLQHAALGDKSPAEVREAESVNGPLAVLDSYYGEYVTLPDDAAYRLNWIKDIYTPACTAKYCLPSFFMSQEDSVTDSNIGADIGKCVNEFKARSILEGISDADWTEFQSNLQAYKVDEYVALYQKYFDAYLDAQ